jgi:hypothetical protein
MSQQLTERFGSVIDGAVQARGSRPNAVNSTHLQLWQVVRSIEMLPDDANARHWLRVGWSAEVDPVIHGYQDLLQQLEAGNAESRFVAEQVLEAPLPKAFATFARWWLYDRHESGPVHWDEKGIEPGESEHL